ncbi:hypothetical protein Fmac_014951 [Flemingia macrophylla]|uniref:BHLH domain-containing protein n=1 Tax=Flemingia macrophylla TaxID=520843 RepID=A0ABD1MDZ6_9FABA
MTDSLRISTRQAFGFHNGKSLTQQPDSDLVPARIKGEMINTVEESSLIPIHEPRYSPSFLSSFCVTGEELFLAENNVYHHHKPINAGNLSKRSNFGDLPSVSNLPTLDMTSLVSCSLGFNPKMLDLHTSNYGLQPCYNTFGLNEGISLSYGDMHGRENSPSNSSNKISSFTREVAMTKRAINCSLPKESEAKAKKSRSSCSPLKTSTASVLSEAIGYIHFLHQQVQTLSIPYMKSAQSKPSRMMQMDSNSRELKPDLRSRGLCLVPLSYASFIHRCV